jgi:hypothetical protein
MSEELEKDEEALAKMITEAPDWLRESWARAKELGLDTMTIDEIDEEIAAYRREKRAAGR